jgi:hypothetical protein
MVLVFLASLIVLMMLKRWLERKNALTRNILWLFIMYTAGMALTSYSKLIKYIINFPVYETGSYLYNILYGFRFASFFSALAGLFFYRFYVDVFVQKQETIRGKKFVIIFSLIASLCQLLPFFGGMNELAVKSLILIQAAIIYFPVAIKSYRLVQRTKWESGDVELYWGFLLLFLLALFFIGIWVSYVLSYITDILLTQNYGAFYFIMQGFVIAMLFCVYLCFIMPPWFKKYVEKRKNAKLVIQ